MPKQKLKFGSAFAKHFVKNELLVPHLNNWFANNKFPDEIPLNIRPNKEKDNAFHPSSGLACSRYLQAMLDGILPEQINSMESNKNFMFGHYVHALVQYIVVEELKFATWDDIEKEYDYDFETARGNPYRIRGFTDIARCIIPNNDPILCDIKTMNSRIYAQENPGQGLLDKYNAQVKLYLSFEELDKAIILCAEKDSPHRFKEIVVERDERFVDKAVARWESVVDDQAEGRLAPCTCEDQSTCPVRDLYDDTTEIQTAVDMS